MLDERGVKYRYREYTQEPLSKTEIKKVLGKLGVQPKDVLRKNDAAYKKLGLTSDEPADELIELMSEHPTLLQRPIAIDGRRAVVGRPVDNLLELIDP